MPRPSILLIGNDTDEINKIEHILSKQKKYRILKAYSAEDAIQIVKKKNRGLFKLSRNKVKLILFESRMPEGITALKQIVNIDANLRTIIVSPDMQTSNWLDSYFECNSIAYISKPVNENELVWTLDAFFKGKENLVKSCTFRDMSLRE